MSDWYTSTLTLYHLVYMAFFLNFLLMFLGHFWLFPAKTQHIVPLSLSKGFYGVCAANLIEVRGWLSALGTWSEVTSLMGWTAEKYMWGPFEIICPRANKWSGEALQTNSSVRTDEYLKGKHMIASLQASRKNPKSLIVPEAFQTMMWNKHLYLSDDFTQSLWQQKYGGNFSRARVGVTFSDLHRKGHRDTLNSICWLSLNRFTRRSVPFQIHTFRNYKKLG